jgi:hypothetical protein
MTGNHELSKLYPNLGRDNISAARVTDPEYFKTDRLDERFTEGRQLFRL